MKKPALILFLIALLGYLAGAQVPVSRFRALADSAMRKEIDPAVRSRVRCSSAWGDDTSGKRFEIDEPETTADTLVHAAFIVLEYALDCPQLREKLRWYLTVDTSGRVLPAESIRKALPACIRLNRPCTLLTKEEAIAIAIKDSIPYPNNFNVSFESPKRSDEFYWVINSVHPRDYNYSIPGNEGRADFPLNEQRTRIINAATGKLVPVKEYNRLDRD